MVRNSLKVGTMFGISTKQSASSQSLLTAQTSAASNRKRHNPENEIKSKFSSVVKRLAQGVSRQWKEVTAPPGGSQMTNSVGRVNAPVTQHALRTVHFPSTPAVREQAEFPFQVSHNYSAGVQPCNKAPSVDSLLPQLARSLANKQGFVYIRNETGPSPLATFVHSIRNSGSINLGNGCRLIGAYAPPIQKQSVFSPLWTFQIYDANLEATFEVPVTEVPFNNLADPYNRTEQLIHLNNCMDTHLRALPDEFKDSAECPSIICPEFPRLAQLLTAQEECLGRQYRGTLNCRQSIDWICAAEELLQTISPESPRFRGEESCDFESFFRRTGVYNIGLQPLQFSIGHPGANHRESAVIRGYKRHLPGTKPTPAQSPTRPKLTSGHPAERQSASTANAASSSKISPQQWLQGRDAGWAYKEPSRQMQCASQAINGVLQREAVTPEKMASHIATHRLNMLHQMSIPPDDQKGLMHPQVLAAILNGETVEISKREFMGTEPDDLDIASEQTHRESWQKLINLSPIGQGKNWMDHGRELHAVQTLRITPDLWLSAQRGAETNELLTLLNDELNANRRNHLPREMVHWSVAEHRRDIQQLEAAAQRSISNQRDFPIVIRIGGESGHFQTIIPDSKGNWLSLNSDATLQTGVQACNRWCAAGALADSFQHHGVSDILIPNQF